MSVRISWAFDPTVVITQFDIEKSTNKGLTYSALGTIPFSLTGPSYDKQEKRFFYTDVLGNPGDIYKVTSTGANGVSEAAILVAPPSALSKCTIIGYVVDSFGRVDPNMRVAVASYGSRNDQHWIDSPSGVVAYNPQAMGIRVEENIIYPNESGIWQVDLVQKSIARVTISELQFDWAFEVPAKAGPVNIRDIPQLRGASFDGIWPQESGTPARITRG